MLGYDVEGGKMTINEEGARVVRLIFHKFVNEGKGTHVIARELREEGIEPYACQGMAATRSFCELYATRNTAATWCRKRPIRQISYLTKRNTIEVKRNL